MLSTFRTNVCFVCLLTNQDVSPVLQLRGDHGGQSLLRFAPRVHQAPLQGDVLQEGRPHDRVVGDREGGPELRDRERRSGENVESVERHV